MQEEKDVGCFFFLWRYCGRMAGKKGRSGRKGTGAKRAYQVRLLEAQADAFDARVRELDEQAGGRGTRASAASVLQMLVARWLAENTR